MRPALALVGFVLGSAAGIAFSLFGVLVVYLVLGPEYPPFAAETGPLVGHLLLFGALTAVAAVACTAQVASG